jgi:oligopeptide transport system substrate-binding protein
MSKKLLAIIASGAVAVSLVSPAAQAAKTPKKTTTKKKPVATAAPTTAAQAAAPAPATTVATSAAPAAGALKKGGGVVNVGTFSSGDPTTAGDPGLSSVVNESQVANMLFDGLMEIDYETGELKPSVAEAAPTVDAAGTTVVFKVRKGVKFSNGEDVLPSSFACSWNRTVQPDFGSKLGYHFDTIEGKAAVDDGKAKTMSGVVANDGAMTVTIKLVSPYADFIAETQHTVFSPLTKAGCAAGKNYHDGVMIGNGPFIMSEPWKRGQYIKLARNESYFGGIKNHKAYLDTVEFKIVKDELAALNVFESGQADITGTTAGRFNELTKKYGNQGAQRPQLVIQYVGFNWEDKTVGGFQNAKLRQAISLAADRSRINAAIFDGSRAEATGFTPPGIKGTKVDAYGLDKSPNVTKAKQLMAEYGKDAPEITMKLANTPASVQIGSVFVNAVKTNIGVDIKLAPENSTGYFDRLREGPGQMFRAGWAGDFTGYDNFMFPLFDSAGIGSDNLCRFGNAEVDKLIDQARRTPDTNARNALYQRAEQIIMEQAIAVPLYWNKWSTIMSEKMNKEAFAKAQGPTAFVDYNEVALK